MPDVLPENQEDFTTNQLPEKKDLNPRLVMVAITALTVVVLFFGASNWLNSLKTPFALTANINQSQNNGLAAGNLSDLQALQQKDTDFDGLSDYDEMYLYNTSAYLPDTDSDGFDDFTEVQSGQDPNCPKGQDCLSSYTASEEVNLPGLSEQGGVPQLSAQEIRALLLESGMTQEEVSTIDDATLETLYDQAQQAAGNSIEQNNLTLSDLPGLEEALNNLNFDLSSQQIRQLLVESGASQSEVNKLSDQQILDLWQETIKP